MVDLMAGLRGVYDGDDSEIGASSKIPTIYPASGKAKLPRGRVKCRQNQVRPGGYPSVPRHRSVKIAILNTQGKYLSETVERVSSHLHCYLDTSGLMTDAIDALSGKDTVPILTIHKSKGLEYDTIFFIGLDDGAFWNFDSQQEEETCAFFVAFSRAKQRVYFTFSETRNFGRTLRVESRDKVRTLYDLLEQAGAEIVDLRNT